MYKYIKYILIDILEFLAIALWFAYLYFSLWSFIRAAVALNCVDVQKVSYVVYSVLFLLLPTVFAWSPSRLNKRTLLRIVCFGFALVLIVGTIADLITFKGLIGYTFVEGDAVFVNLIMNLPNLWGAVFCLVLAGLYIAFGINITERPLVAYLIFLSIFIIDAVLPFLISFGLYDMMPRLTWIKKSMFLLPIQFLILLTMTFGITARKYWAKLIF